MKNKKIVAALVLALFFAMPQLVLAQGSGMQGAYYGQYTSDVPGFSGDIEFTIDSDDSLTGEMTMRGAEYDLDLDLVMQRPNMEVFRGSITRKSDGFATDIAITISVHPDIGIVGRIMLLRSGLVLGYTAEEVQ